MTTRSTAGTTRRAKKSEEEEEHDHGVENDVVFLYRDTADTKWVIGTRLGHGNLRLAQVYADSSPEGSANPVSFSPEGPWCPWCGPCFFLSGGFCVRSPLRRICVNRRTGRCGALVVILLVVAIAMMLAVSGITQGRCPATLPGRLAGPDWPHGGGALLKRPLQAEPGQYGGPA